MSAPAIVVAPAFPDPELLTTDKGFIKACEHNARVLIGRSTDFAALHFDDFYARMRFAARDWTDADDLNTLGWLQRQHRVATFTLGQARIAARMIAYQRRRDRLRDFVAELPEWDGTERIANAFCNGWGAPSSRLSFVSARNFFIAMIARALEPGAKVDTVWSFEGSQGIGKSRALKALGGEFHAEIAAPIGTPDFMREMRGVWLAELAELDALRGREASTIKRLLSATEDRFVEKFQVHAERYPRRAVAVATTNEADYWQDPTGARRLVPVPCTRIRDDHIAEMRLQWFAEARDLYLAGVPWWTFPADLADAQEARQDIDPWEHQLRDLIANGKPSGHDGMGCIPWPDAWISTAAIMRDWLQLPASTQGRPAGVRVGKIMRRLGFAPHQHGPARERGWLRNTTAPGDGRCSG